MTNKDNKQQAMTKKCNKQLQKINNNKLKTTNNTGKKQQQETTNYYKQQRATNDKHL